MVSQIAENYELLAMLALLLAGNTPNTNLAVLPGILGDLDFL